MSGEETPSAGDPLEEVFKQLDNGPSFLEQQAEAEKALVAAQDKALKEKNLLPEGFTSSVTYTARVQPEDSNVDTEEKVRMRFQTKRSGGREVQIVWDLKFDPASNELVSNTGEYDWAPNQNGVTREGIVLFGPKIEQDGEAMMEFGE